MQSESGMDELHVYYKKLGDNHQDRYETDHNRGEFEHHYLLRHREAWRRLQAEQGYAT